MSLSVCARVCRTSQSIGVSNWKLSELTGESLNLVPETPDCGGDSVIPVNGIKEVSVTNRAHRDKVPAPDPLQRLRLESGLWPAGGMEEASQGRWPFHLYYTQDCACGQSTANQSPSGPQQDLRPNNREQRLALVFSFTLVIEFMKAITTYIFWNTGAKQ